MIIELKRFCSKSDYTIGALLIDSNFKCFTLEDEKRTVKVYGETRIPEGTYDIKLRTTGGFHQRYTKKFGSFHKGMLWLQDVPNFQYILIHIGNKDDDTAGCILVGNVAYNTGTIGHSTDAYKAIYPIISDELLKGNNVEIKISEV